MSDAAGIDSVKLEKNLPFLGTLLKKEQDLAAYADQLAGAKEDFEVVALERTFEGPIVNPATGAQSRSFTLAGKVDELRGLKENVIIGRLIPAGTLT